MNDHVAEPVTITSSRIFLVAAEELFEAFRNPEFSEQWWGPEGFTNTFHEFDLRPGGKWRLTMRGPNGAEYQNDKTFLEVMDNQRVSFEHHGAGPHFFMTHDYEPVPEGTKLTWTMRFPERVENEKFKSFILDANEQNFDRLEDALRKKAKL